MRHYPEIWKYLEENNISQKEFAAEAGVGYSTLNKLLMGRTKNTSKTNQWKIATRMGKDPGDIFEKNTNKHWTDYDLVCPYKNLMKFIRTECGTIHGFANIVGISSVHAADILKLGSSPTKIVIDSILKVTGMTYEECFKEGF